MEFKIPHLALIAAGTGHKIPLKCQKLSYEKLDISKLPMYLSRDVGIEFYQGHPPKNSANEIRAENFQKF